MPEFHSLSSGFSKRSVIPYRRVLFARENARWPNGNQNEDFSFLYDFALARMKVVDEWIAKLSGTGNDNGSGIDGAFPQGFIRKSSRSPVHPCIRRQGSGTLCIKLQHSLGRLNDNGSGIDGAWDAVAGEETGNEPDAVTENGSDMVTAGPSKII